MAYFKITQNVNKAFFLGGEHFKCIIEMWKIVKKLNRTVNKQNGIGIGDDLFEAFFADEEAEPAQKKKPSTTAAPVEVTSAAPVKPAVKKSTIKRKTPVKKTVSKKTTTATPPKPTESAEKDDDKDNEKGDEKPQFQHTPALLELAQQSTEEKISSGEKLDSATEKVRSHQ